MITHELIKFVFVIFFSYEVFALMSAYKIMSLHSDKVTIIVHLCILFIFSFYISFENLVKL